MIIKPKTILHMILVWYRSICIYLHIVHIQSIGQRQEVGLFVYKLMYGLKLSSDYRSLLYMTFLIHMPSPYRCTGCWEVDYCSRGRKYRIM